MINDGRSTRHAIGRAGSSSLLNMLVFNHVAANPPGTTGLVPVKRRKSLMDHRLEAGATLVQLAAKEGAFTCRF